MDKLKFPEFQNINTLIRDLENNATNFPLIKKLYFPILKMHDEKYKDKNINNDINDWLIFPYFCWIYFLDKIDVHEKKELEKVEQDLAFIKLKLGDEEFDSLCLQFQKDCMHETIFEVHNRLINQYGELKAIKYYLKKGYSVEKISEGKVKTADLKISNDEESLEVECKFVRQSDKVQSFFNAYKSFLRYVPGYKPLTFGLCDRWFNSLYVNDLSAECILFLKKFIKDIYSQRIDIVNRKCSVKAKLVLNFRSKDNLDPNLEPISEQVASSAEKFNEFLNGYILRRVEQAKKQLSKKEINSKVFLFVHLDPEYNAPFQEMSLKKKDLIKNFQQKHNLENLVDLYFFPPIAE